MKVRLIAFILTAFQLLTYGQNSFTARKGSKFFPGHFDIALTVDSNCVRYELFNHWYSGCYAELRQLKIQIDSLATFNQSNDTIEIKLLGNKIQLKDKKFNISEKVKNTKLCTSPEKMRKISFAYKLASSNELGPQSLYSLEDLKLTELEFEKKVKNNLKLKKITTP